MSICWKQFSIGGSLYILREIYENSIHKRPEILKYTAWFNTQMSQPCIKGSVGQQVQARASESRKLGRSWRDSPSVPWDAAGKGGHARAMRVRQQHHGCGFIRTRKLTILYNYDGWDFSIYGTLGDGTPSLVRQSRRGFLHSCHKISSIFVTKLDRISSFKKHNTISSYWMDRHWQCTFHWDKGNVTRGPISTVSTPSTVRGGPTVTIWFCYDTGYVTWDSNKNNTAFMMWIYNDNKTTKK